MNHSGPIVATIGGIAYAVGLASMPPAWAIPMLSATIGGAVGAALAVVTLVTFYRGRR